MGSLVQDASPFLFPCTIEYSLICAAILYVMWKNISKAGFTQPTTPPRHHAHAYRYGDTIRSPTYDAAIRVVTIPLLLLLRYRVRTTTQFANKFYRGARRLLPKCQARIMMILAQRSGV